MAQGPAPGRQAPPAKANAETGAQDIILKPGIRLFGKRRGTVTPPMSAPSPASKAGTLSPEEAAEMRAQPPPTKEAAGRYPERPPVSGRFQTMYDALGKPLPQQPHIGEPTQFPPYLEYSPETVYAMKLGTTRELLAGGEGTKPTSQVVRKRDVGTDVPQKAAPADATQSARQRTLPMEPSQPAAVRKRIDDTRKQIKDNFDAIKAALALSIQRGDVRRAIPALFDAADANTAMDTSNAKGHIVVTSTPVIDPKLTGFAKMRALAKAKAAAKVNRESGIAYISAGVTDENLGLWTADPKQLPKLEAWLDEGDARARTWTYDRNPFRRIEAKRWQSALRKYREALEYTKAHWNDRDFGEGNLAYQTEMEEHRKWEEDQGAEVEEKENYIPGLFEGHFWGDDFITFGTRRLLGKDFRAPSKFSGPFEAIAKGPFYLANRDLAELAGHRIRQGHQMVERRMVIYQMQHDLKDPTGDPVLERADLVNKGNHQPAHRREAYRARQPVSRSGLRTHQAAKRRGGGRQTRIPKRRQGHAASGFHQRVSNWKCGGGQRRHSHQSDAQARRHYAVGHLPSRPRHAIRLVARRVQDWIRRRCGGVEVTGRKTWTRR